MNPLIFLWLVFIIVISVKSNKKKNGTTQNKTAVPPRPQQKPLQTQVSASSAMSGAEELTDKTESDLYHEGNDPCHSDFIPVSDRIQPFSGPEAYIGSLEVESMEGVDVCHPDHDHPLCTEIAETPITEDEITGPSPLVPSSWSGDEVLRAVVMQEILKRPSQRNVRA